MRTQLSRFICASLLASGCLLRLGSPSAAQTTSVTVPATACPWLAGMPNGTTGIPYQGGDTGNDVAPDESPVQVPSATITPGRILNFSATGLGNFMAGTPYIAPDGNASYIFGTGKDFNQPAMQPLQSFDGMSGVYAPATSLLGVFLSNSQPNTLSPPAFTDYTTAQSRNFLSTAPLLQQVFYIGDGLTTAGTTQFFTVPTGATRLYLGTMDGFEWTGNPGAFNVTITSSAGTPEPGSIPLLALSGLPVLGTVALRQCKALKAA